MFDIAPSMKDKGIRDGRHHLVEGMVKKVLPPGPVSPTSSSPKPSFISEQLIFSELGGTVCEDRLAC